MEEVDQRVSKIEPKQAKKAFPLGHKYVLLISACTAFAMSVGFVATFGTFLLDILDEYGQSRASAALIQAVMIGITLCAGLPNGILINRLGPRKCGMLGGILLSVGTAASFFASSVLYLIISFGVVAGWGNSLMFLSATVATGRHFDGSWKLLALSLVTGSSGIGMVVFPYVISSLVSQYGLRWTFLILAGLLMNIVPAAALWESEESECNVIDTSGSHRNGYRNMCIRRNIDDAFRNIKESWNSYRLNLKILLKNSSFVLFILSVMFSLPALNSLVYFFFDILRSKGFSSTSSLHAFLVCNTLNAIGRFAPGILKKVQSFGALWIVTSFLILGETGYVGLTLSDNFPLVMVFSALIGSALGGLVGSLATVTATETGPKDFNIGFSFLMTSAGISNTLAGPIGGLIFDRTQSYDFVLYSNSVGIFCGIVFSILGSIVRRRRQKKRIRAHSVYTITRF